MSRFHDIAEQLGLRAWEFQWAEQDDGTVLDGDGRAVCVLGDPFEELSAKDLENFALVLSAPFLRNLVIQLTKELLIARKLDQPAWLDDLDAGPISYTPVIRRVQRLFALLDQHQ